MEGDNLKTEQGISECYLEGCLKHSGSISGFIHVFTQLVKASEGDGRLVLADVDEALARLLGELGAITLSGHKGRGGDTTRTLDPMRSTGNEGDSLDMMNRLFWLSNETFPPPVEEVIAQAAESLADPNFFIAEISGIISALVELKSVAETMKAEKL